MSIIFPVLVFDLKESISQLRCDDDKMVSKTTKERVVYWATKLECPVDDNANYENTYVCSIDILEVSGLEADRMIAVV